MRKTPKPLAIPAILAVLLAMPPPPARGAEQQLDAYNTYLSPPFPPRAAPAPDAGRQAEGHPGPGAPPFARRLLVGPHRKALLLRLNAALAALPCDAPWRASAARHQLALAPCTR